MTESAFYATDPECVTGPDTPAALRCAAGNGRRVLPERRRKVSARAAQAGRKTAEDAGGQGDSDGEREHAPVWSDDEQERLIEAAGDQPGERVHAYERNQHA